MQVTELGSVCLLVIGTSCQPWRCPRFCRGLSPKPPCSAAGPSILVIMSLGFFDELDAVLKLLIALNISAS